MTQSRGSCDYGEGSNLLIVEYVPVLVCPTCGERCLTAKTLREHERIKFHRRSPARSRAVPVVNFD